MVGRNRQITRLERYRRLNSWSYSDLGIALGVHGATARRYCLVRGHKDWRWMKADANDRLKKLTGDTLHAGNYFEVTDMPSPLAAGVVELMEAAA